MGEADRRRRKIVFERCHPGADGVPRVRVRPGLIAPRQKNCLPVMQHLDQQVLARGEVPIERAGSDPGRAGDFVKETFTPSRSKVAFASERM